MIGTLFLVSVPIGNADDISLRAIEAIRHSEILAAEERKPTNQLLHKLNIQREYVLLNEHTIKETTEELIAALLDGKTIALISDAGTPLVADPGQELTKKAIEMGAKVTTVPGASSILPALQLSGFLFRSFQYVGFLPREKSERLSALKDLRSYPHPLIFLETPYRLAQLLDDLHKTFGEMREAAVCCELTTPSEKVVRGTLSEVRSHYAERPFKGEFVIVVKGERRSR